MEQANSTKTWQKASRTAIFLAVFLVPLIFLPFTSNVLDFNKQTVLVFLVLASLFSWLLKSLIEEKITLELSWFNLVPVIFVLFSALSTLFSAYKYGSFWGWPLVISSSFLTTLALVLLYFLIIHLFKQPEDVFGLIFVLVFAGLLVSLISLPQILGKFPLPFDFTKANSFNPIGTVNSLAIFLASLLPMAASLIFISRSRAIKFLVWLFVILSLFLLLAINFQTAWLVLLVGSSLILVFGISRREIFNLSWLFLPMLLLAVALFALVMRTSIIPTADLPAEVSPTLGASFNIAFRTIKDFRPPFSWFFGSGPGTFVYDYAKYKPLEINQTVFWGTRFGSGSSEVVDRLATTGLFGFLSFLSVILMGWILGLRSIISREFRKENFAWILLIGIFGSFAGLTLGLFLYSANLSSMFLLFLLLAAIFSLVGAKSRSFDLKPAEPVEGKKPRMNAPFVTVGVSFAFIAVLIASMGIFFIQGQRYFAEINYLKALQDVQKGNNTAAVNRLASAIRLTNSSQDNYWRDLSQVYLFRINEEAGKPDLTQEERSKRVSDLITLLVASAKSSSDASPQNVANWSIRGYVYSQLLNLINGADNWAISAYEEVLKLEPANPFTYTALGQVYANRADNLASDKEKVAERQQALDQAREKFQKAKDLKSDYAPARFQLAMIDIRENKVKDAITKLEETKVIAPFDTGLAFQLGLIYQADNQKDKAQAEFERAVALDPNYANARYFLGLLYDQAGEKQKAIDQFEKIVQLNPDNELVKKILENLRASKPALEGLTQAQPQPPIQETPKEQLQPQQPTTSPKPS
ncbi:MAG: tetratricopeptide repeat protein, partial [bacterium]|nr:tetratricopeptide repeat protein [bacterium]